MPMQTLAIEEIQSQQVQSESADLLYANSAPAMYTYPMLQHDLVTLLTKYPTKLQISSLGQSVQGREIYQIIWGNPNAPYAVFVDASIHAREYINSQLVIAMLDFYGGCELGNVCFYIIPMANPDGVTLSQIGPLGLTPQNSGFAQAGYAVEAREFKTLDRYVQRWKANANGVDINRNFPTGWEGSEQKGYPCNELFKGAEPASEPETQLLMKAAGQRAFDLAVNYHSMGNLLYYGSAAATPALQQASYIWANFVSGSTGYPIRRSTGKNMGTFADYLTIEAGIPSVTIESGARPCPTGADEFPLIWQRNYALWGSLIQFFQARP